MHNYSKQPFWEKKLKQKQWNCNTVTVKWECELKIFSYWKNFSWQRFKLAFDRNNHALLSIQLMTYRSYDWEHCMINWVTPVGNCWTSINCQVTWFNKQCFKCFKWKEMFELIIFLFSPPHKSWNNNLL